MMVLSLPLLLVLRAFLYHQLGAAVNWTPTLRFGGLPVMFRSDLLDRILAYSFLSFWMTMLVFYTALLLLSALNRRPPSPDPMGGLVRVALGPLGGAPVWIQLVSPMVAGTATWLLGSLLLGRMGLLPEADFWPLRVTEAALAGAGLYLTWKYVLALVLGMHVLHSYVHLGRHPVWTYADTLARVTLRPLAGVSLRVGRVDFAPVLLLMAVFLAADRLEWLLGWLYTRYAL